MSLRITKPAFNVREKINELEGIVSYDRMPQGSVIQVVQGRLTNQTESSAGVNVDVDIGLYAYISPRYRTSKILVTLDSLPIRMRSGSTSVHFLLQRRIGSEQQSGQANSYTWLNHVATAEYSGVMTPADTYNFEYYPGLNYLDSPGTTELVGYRIIGNKNSGSGGVAYNHNAGGGRGAHNYATLTLMEIKQ